MGNAGKRRKSRRDNRPEKIRYYDYSLLAILIFLVCFGLVMLYSTSSYSALVSYAGIILRAGIHWNLCYL